MRRCPGCGRSIALHLYACGVCWRLLPKRLRDNVSVAWAARRAARSPEIVADHEAAKTAADKWLSDHYAGQR